MKYMKPYGWLLCIVSSAFVYAQSIECGSQSQGTSPGMLGRSLVPSKTPEPSLAAQALAGINLTAPHHLISAKDYFGNTSPKKAPGHTRHSSALSAPNSDPTTTKHLVSPNVGGATGRRLLGNAGGAEPRRPSDSDRLVGNTQDTWCTRFWKIITCKKCCHCASADEHQESDLLYTTMTNPVGGTVPRPL